MDPLCHSRYPGSCTRAPRLHVSNRLRIIPAALALGVGAALLSGCISSGKDAPLNPYLRSDGGGVTVGTLRVFGDSYSVPSFSGMPTWPTFVAAETRAGRVDNQAIGGATAASMRPSAFNRQLDNWSASGVSTGRRDMTVVYFGYNDIGRGGSGDNLSAASGGYREGVNRLINAGAAADDRRIFLTQIHDWSRNPGVSDGVRGQVRAWNAFVAGEANRHPNVIAVDLYTYFERLYREPGRFGFQNVTTVDAGRSSTDALYLDPIHFGIAGQQAIARVYLHYITRGWDWASRVDAGEAAAVQLENAINNGLLLINHQRDSGIDSPISLVPVGARGATVVDRLSEHRQRLANTQLDGDSIATDTPESAASGFLLSYRLDGNDHRPTTSPGHRIGLSVSSNQGQFNGVGPADWRHGERWTDSLGVHWQQDHGAVLGVTQLGYHAHRFEQLSSDDLLALSADNRDTGQSWRLSHRISGGIDTGPVTLVPNLTLAYQQDTLHASVAESLYTSPVHFNQLRASHSLADLGLSIVARPMSLGNGRSLQFTGSINQELGLHRDTLDVQYSEQRMQDVVQSDRLDRGQYSRLHLSIGADLMVTEQADIGLRVMQARDRQTDSISTLGTLNARVRF